MIPAFGGSNPPSPVRMKILWFGSLAQSVEHLTFNQDVPGSIPGWLILNLIVKVLYAGVAELADALDLGSSAARCKGSTPFARIK